MLLPINAYSGRSGLGHLSIDGLEIRYEAFVICMLYAKKVKFAKPKAHKHNCWYVSAEAFVLWQQTGAICKSQHTSSAMRSCKEISLSFQKQINRFFGGFEIILSIVYNFKLKIQNLFIKNNDYYMCGCGLRFFSRLSFGYCASICLRIPSLHAISVSFSVSVRRASV